MIEQTITTATPMRTVEYCRRRSPSACRQATSTPPRATIVEAKPTHRAAARRSMANSAVEPTRDVGEVDELERVVDGDG